MRRRRVALGLAALVMPAVVASAEPISVTVEVGSRVHADIGKPLDPRALIATATRLVSKRPA